MKIATWNVNSLRVRLPHVLKWLTEAQPDILALQETKLTDDLFPAEAFAQHGYQVAFAGQKTYNGVAIISKQPIKDTITAIPHFADPQKRVLAATIKKIRLINVYIPNGMEVGSDKFEYKLTWLQHLTNWLKQELATHNNLLILGDFNIAPEAIDVHNPQVWEGRVLFSEPERAAFKRLLQLGLVDSFRLFDQPEKSYSWWDYRNLAFRRNHGLRIDHILVSEALAKQCRACIIDKPPRKWERPSDHTPVMAEFAKQ